MRFQDITGQKKAIAKVIDDMSPDIWSKIIPRYDSYNNALEQIKSDIYFSDFIRSVVTNVT